ncbi:ABC-2 transporter permease [Staphylococcus chromogenes]|uniref:ABC-2 transporter permease n=1 Tax=Staphylococcus chromogenes TaxID=46126 RepID=UPI0028FE20F3|nr:ABC-2 transporter permease [Staphylococcus chromogenes]MDU0477587.1 ABC-2 transporter permease [Staphylococcus chromogenes]
MKGLLLNNYYSNKKSLIIYFITGCLFSIIFSYISPLMSGFMFMMMLVTPATDNLKGEKDSRFLYFVSTMPISRKTYVSSHFLFYLILGSISLVGSSIITMLITQNLLLSLSSALLGIGVITQYTVIFPLTFKLGPEKSNIIFMLASFIIVIVFLVVYFSLLFLSNDNNNLVLQENLGILSLYTLISGIICISSYLFSVYIINRKEL